jgi:Uma2 family endonuclease
MLRPGRLFFAGCFFRSSCSIAHCRDASPRDEDAMMFHMVAAAAFPDRLTHVQGEQRLILGGISYRDYVQLADVLGHRPGLRLTYCKGTLEIMTTSPLHEHLKTLIARLLELHALVRGIRIHGYGSATFRREDADRGFEPDECYCIGVSKDLPDLAIEVVVTSGGVDKLAVYQGLGVKEVWIYMNGAFSIHALGSAGYDARSQSELFPQMDFDVLARHVAMQDQDAAVRAYWDPLKHG